MRLACGIRLASLVFLLPVSLPHTRANRPLGAHPIRAPDFAGEPGSRGGAWRLLAAGRAKAEKKVERHEGQS